MSAQYRVARSNNPASTRHLFTFMQPVPAPRSGSALSRCHGYHRGSWITTRREVGLARLGLAWLGVALLAGITAGPRKRVPPRLPHRPVPPHSGLPAAECSAEASLMLRPFGRSRQLAQTRHDEVSVEIPPAGETVLHNPSPTPSARRVSRQWGIGPRLIPQWSDPGRDPHCFDFIGF